MNTRELRSIVDRHRITPEELRRGPMRVGRHVLHMDSEGNVIGQGLGGYLGAEAVPANRLLTEAEALRFVARHPSLWSWDPTHIFYDPLGAGTVVDDSEFGTVLAFRKADGTAVFVQTHAFDDPASREDPNAIAYVFWETLKAARDQLPKLGTDIAVLIALGLVAYVLITKSR